MVPHLHIKDIPNFMKTYQHHQRLGELSVIGLYETGPRTNIAPPNTATTPKRLPRLHLFKKAILLWFEYEQGWTRFLSEPYRRAIIESTECTTITTARWLIVYARGLYGLDISRFNYNFHVLNAHARAREGLRPIFLSNQIERRSNLRR